MSVLANWVPIQFDPATERAYRQYMIARVLQLSRLAYASGIAAFIAYHAWDMLLMPDPLVVTGPYRLALILTMIVGCGLTFTPAVKRSSRLYIGNLAVSYIAVSIGLTMLLDQLPGGFDLGLSGLVFGMIFVPALVFSMAQAILILLPLVVFPVAIMGITGGSELQVLNAAAWLSGGAVFATGFAYLLSVINRRAFHLERMLAAEKQRSEDLLLNILPAAVAERLKAGEKRIADYVDSASVLFADLVGFTELSRTTEPARLVELLNDLFSRFDALVEQHSAEKIKTIGDAYMAAVGLSGSQTDHAANAANLALDMKAAFAAFRVEHGLDLKLRIGVHSGALVAGVIGTRKFAYDLWGDTVNVASRMESAGIPDEIQISEATRQQLPASFVTEPRGQINVKGHLPQPAYLLQN